MFSYEGIITDFQGLYQFRIHSSYIQFSATTHMLEVSGFQVLKRICSSLAAERGEVPASVRSAGFLQIDLH